MSLVSPDIFNCYLWNSSMLCVQLQTMDSHCCAIFRCYECDLFPHSVDGRNFQVWATSGGTLNVLLHVLWFTYKCIFDRMEWKLLCSFPDWLYQFSCPQQDMRGLLKSLREYTASPQTGGWTQRVCPPKDLHQELLSVRNSRHLVETEQKM